MATETAVTGRDSDKFMLRLPDGMRERIKRSAEASGRTMNAEVVARLQRSFETDQAVEQVAFEHGFERTTLQLEIERLSRLLEEQKSVVPRAEHLAGTAKASGETLDLVKRVDNRLKRIEEAMGIARIELVAPAARMSLEASSPAPEPDKPAKKK